LQEAKKSQNSQPELFVAVFVVEERGVILGILEFAEFVSEKWRQKARFRESKNLVGK
jgi:hypothetical protein